VDGGELAGEDGRVAEVTVEDEAAEIDRRRRRRGGTIKVLSPRSSNSRAVSRF